ncbi:hypothetical protein ACP70R_026668 [Stipagrostis hirtigluma subsp. patula]
MANLSLGSDKDTVDHHGGADAAAARTLEDHVDAWVARKMRAGVPARRCVLPFLTGAPKAVECRLCSKIIYPGEEIKCSVRLCGVMFHLSCAVRDTANFIGNSFKCPQHGCRICKQKMFFWRCGRCTVSAHTKCAPWPVIHDDQGTAICWRHPSDWLLQNKNAKLTNSIEEVFCRLPLPYLNEDFKIDSIARDVADAIYKPPLHTATTCHVSVTNKKHGDVHVEVGNVDPTCKDDSECKDQQAQRNDEHLNKRYWTRPQSGRSKKHKGTSTTAVPCIKRTGSVYPDLTSEKASSVKEQEVKEGKEYTLSRCFDVLDAMDDVSDEIKILASDVFKDPANREIFLCYRPRLRGRWLKKEVKKLHA